jgi:hypothetical protein
MSNDPDFINIPELDIENKLILPTLKLYEQFEFKFSAIYQDIRSILIDIHAYLADVALQWYQHPLETFSTCYDRFENDVLPKADLLFQSWQIQAMTGADQAKQYIQVFWDNPQQTTLAALEPVSEYFGAITEQSNHYWQSFLDNPEQFMQETMMVATNYLEAFSDHTEVVLISSYYYLLELFRILMEQPYSTLHALYANSLSRLLDTYYDLISSLLPVIG